MSKYKLAIYKHSNYINYSNLKMQYANHPELMDSYELYLEKIDEDFDFNFHYSVFYNGSCMVTLYNNYITATELTSLNIPKFSFDINISEFEPSFYDEITGNCYEFGAMMYEKGSKDGYLKIDKYVKERTFISTINIPENLIQMFKNGFDYQFLLQLLMEHISSNIDSNIFEKGCDFSKNNIYYKYNSFKLYSEKYMILKFFIKKDSNNA